MIQFWHVCALSARSTPLVLVAPLCAAVLAGCADPAGADQDASAGDMAAPETGAEGPREDASDAEVPEPVTNLAHINVYDDVPGGDRIQIFFYTKEPALASRTVEDLGGRCVLTHGGEPAREVEHAGEITFSSGDETVTTTPGATGSYPSLNPPATFGATGVSMSAAGSEYVPGFELTAPRGQPLTLISPPKGHFVASRSADFSWSWDPGGAADQHVRVYLSQKSRSVVCEFPRPNGGGVVPKAALARLEPGSGTFAVYAFGADEANVLGRSGPWRIRLVSGDFARFPNGIEAVNSFTVE